MSWAQIPMAEHERVMRLAIEQARKNPAFPFGAVIVRADDLTVLAEGANDGVHDPRLHGEMAAIGDYVRQYGNEGWAETLLYTTGEPCPMCMSAIIWAGIAGVIFATSIAKLVEVGFDQIAITSTAVADAAPFWQGSLLGGVLSAETDPMFMHRKRI